MFRRTIMVVMMMVVVVFPLLRRTMMLVIMIAMAIMTPRPCFPMVRIMVLPEKEGVLCIFCRLNISSSRRANHPLKQAIPS